MAARVKMTGDAVGVIRITAGGSSFICTAMQYSMQMNNIPVATVTIGSGASLRNPGGTYKTPEDLLQAVLDKRKAAYIDMVECTLEEVIKVGGVSRTTMIFKGVIVTGSPVYKAGTPTTRMIRFMCMNAVCKLYSKPLTEYVNMAGSEVINKYAQQDYFSAQSALDSSNLFLEGKLGAAELLQRYAADIRNAPVVDRVAAIVGAVLGAASYPSISQSPMDAQIKDYFFGQYRPDVDKYGDKCGQEFNTTLCQFLIQSLKGASIYDALQSILTSETYMLDLVPRWNGDADNDFKMEIRPSEAWNPSDPISLKEAEIISIDSNYNPIACINTPEAFIVNFSDAVEFAVDNIPGGRYGLNGCYASDEKLAARLRQRYQSGDMVMTAEELRRMYRAKLYTAPFWMQPSIVDPNLQKNGVNGNNSVKNELPPKVYPPKEGNTKEAEPSAETRKRICQIADDIAQALFAFIYGRQDRSVVALYPSLRFGYGGYKLEDSLGKAIDIELTPNSKNQESSSASVMNIRGILESIQYDYTAGQSTSNAYTIGLKCVRPLDKDEPAVPCALYKI